MNGAPSTPPVDPPDLQARASGIVLHITALPGPHGMGDLGDEAWRFVDWLASAGQRLWHVLPLNPVGPGHSPYQSPSAFAGNVSLVALQPLVASGWLPAAALAVGAVAVGRAAGHHAGLVPVIEEKEIGAGPDIGAVVGHEDGHVAHQAHAAAACVGAQGDDLFVEAPLREGVLATFLRQAGAGR